MSTDLHGNARLIEANRCNLVPGYNAEGEERMSMSRQGFVTLVLALVWLSFSAGQAVAQKLYKWTDKGGQVHFSNVGPGGETATEDAGGVKGKIGRAHV